MAKRTRKSGNGNSLSPALVSAIGALTNRTGRVPTQYQIGVFRWAVDCVGHAIVQAVAGSGKTTTIEDLTYIIMKVFGTVPVLLLAFNKAIATELGNRIGYPSVQAKTLNGLGHGVLMKNLKNRFTIDDNKTDKMLFAVTDFDTLDKEQQKEVMGMLPAVRKLIGLMKGFGYGAIRALPTEQDINFLCDRYDVELPEGMEVSVFMGTLLRTFERGINERNIMDFNDQLFMPIYLDMPFPTYFKFVGVDEAQDLNLIQHEMVRRIAARGARCLFVGDRFQAIYGFRGSDPESMDKISHDFDATELPLSICWRCPKAVIEAAQEIVPSIEYAPTAKDGKVDHIKEDEFLASVDHGDFVICRTMAPLAEHCMQLIRDGKKATIRGRDIGAGLCSTLDKIGKAWRGDSSAIWQMIDSWGEKELAKLNKPGNENKIEKLQDRIMTLQVLSEGCKSINEVKDKIKRIFSDDINGIVLSTIHRVKGLENDRVFIIHPELLPHPMARQPWAREQEKNLEYVAITRSRNYLAFVQAENPIEFRHDETV